VLKTTVSRRVLKIKTVITATRDNSIRYFLLPLRASIVFYVYKSNSYKMSSGRSVLLNLQLVPFGERKGKFLRPINRFINVKRNGQNMRLTLFNSTCSFKIDWQGTGMVGRRRFR
jgi:hypothetical protein